MFLETARSKSRSRAPPAASGGVRHVAGGWGKEHPSSHQPERWGRSWASRPSRCAVAARALTPIHSDSAPQAPARGPLARFSSGGRVKGLVRPAAPQGRGHGPLTRPGDPSLPAGCRGRSSPGTPCPSAKAPGRAAGRLIGVRCRGHPCLGFQGARSLELRSSALHGPQKGPKSEDRREPRKATNSGVLGFPM